MIFLPKLSVKVTVGDNSVVTLSFEQDDVNVIILAIINVPNNFKVDFIFIFFRNTNVYINFKKQLYFFKLINFFLKIADIET
jgi:hypothetical protein